MPLEWNRNKNPYKVNSFTILRCGPNASRQVIFATQKNLIRRQKRTSHIVDDQNISEARIQEAGNRLLNEEIWAEEVLLVHPVDPTTEKESKILQKIGKAILQQTTPSPSTQNLKLSNLQALTPLLPEPCAEDVLLPEWEEFGIPDANSPEDRQYDIQFDL